MEKASDVRVAVVGAGYWGTNLVRNFRALSVLDTVCDIDEGSLSACKEKFGPLNTTSRFDDLLDSKQIDGIVISTPASTHFELAKRAILAGKDIFVEKPLALNVEDGEELVKLAHDSRRVLMVGHVLEYHPAITKLKSLVELGKVGKVKYVYSNRLNLGKIRREENILWSFAPHDIAVILRLVGEMPSQVIASGGAFIRPEIADVTVTQFIFPDDMGAHIFVSWLNPFKEQRLVIVGSQGMIVFDDVFKKLVFFEGDHAYFKHNEGTLGTRESVAIDFPLVEPLKIECEAFLEAIRSRVDPLTDGESGLAVLRVLSAAQQSMVSQGKSVRLSKDIAIEYEKA